MDDVLFFTRHSRIDLYVRGSGVSYVIRDVRGVFRDRVLHERVRAIHEVPLWEREIDQVYPVTNTLPEKSGIMEKPQSTSLPP